MTTATPILELKKEVLLFPKYNNDSPIENFDLTLWREAFDKPWPTMYDLPSENQEEPGLPDLFHDIQADLLTECYRPADYPADHVFAAADLNLYYDLAHPQWYKRPDWYGVVGVSRLYSGTELRNSYVVWDEGVAPFVVTEFLSPGTEDEDLGKTVAEENKPPTKWQVYEKILQIPYYVIYDEPTQELQGFKLTGGKYCRMKLEHGRLWLPELKLGLGLWHGKYQGCEHEWLRWCSADGTWVPTPLDLERQAKEVALSRAQQVESRAQQERQAKEIALYRTQQERQAKEEALSRAQQERQAKEEALYRVQALANKLRELGIDPTTI